ncbi:MAG: ergothioneine biosynthesis protein EgtB [Candidatus Palauibacterales bacterium]|nr:ergothioneine biosynthesis protein EgtB [Candidatus Palauibacterales bacterium]
MGTEHLAESDTVGTRPAPGDASADRRGARDAADLLGRYRRTRRFTERLCDPLKTEDMVVQSRENVSPTKWHLAHVSWFFETFLLEPFLPGYEPIDDTYGYLFNSYYVQAGERHCRDRRGYISRPTVDRVLEYRRHVDSAMERLLAEDGGAGDPEEIRSRTTLGIHHEQQHQELLLTDIKHVFSVNPLRPAYQDVRPDPAPVPEMEWIDFGEGVREIGHDGSGFSYDNERPRHEVYVHPFEIASRPVTCGEYLEFMRDDGYGRPELWLSDGWAEVQERGWTEPFYWEERDGTWVAHTLSGLRPVEESEPVSHLSYYEADAFARWADARLPTEEEWELAAGSAPVEGNFVESGLLHPAPAASEHAGDAESGLLQMFGDVWEWTRSQYEPYPGFEPLDGALGEYNGKFMCDQFVLRGGSCATSRTHIRPTYRNFFHADESWQFTGVRLARDA